METIVKLTNVSKIYGRHLVLDNVNMTINKDEQINLTVKQIVKFIEKE